MTQQTRQQVAHAVRAVESKKGEDLAILEMDQASGAFTDYFIICSGSNPRQIQAICDEVERQLAQTGLRPNSLEGYNQAEWVLLDYVDFVVHVFSERARAFYDLERLWKSAQRLKPADLKKPASKTTTTAKKASPRKASAVKKLPTKRNPARKKASRTRSAKRR